MNKRGQGISINYIVIIIIAVLVLVLVMLFATGTIPKLFKQTADIAATTDTDVTVFRSGCQNSCFNAKETVNSEVQWKTSSYCLKTKAVSYDYSGDGKIEDTEDIKETNAIIKCWDEPISAECSFDITVGEETKSCTAYDIDEDTYSCECRSPED